MTRAWNEYERNTCHFSLTYGGDLSIMFRHWFVEPAWVSLWRGF